MDMYGQMGQMPPPYDPYAMGMMPYNQFPIGGDPYAMY